MTAQSQNPLSRFKGMGGGRSKTGDSLQHRVDDTITINFRYLDSSRLQKIDSSIYDFYQRYPLPATFIDLGNLGNAAHDLVFHPLMKPGWDPGWHAYDPYIFTMDETKFFNTTKPYSELGYIIGTKAEQMINVIHTQNINRNWNALFQYRLINSPGQFNNQSTNHNNYRFSSWYASKNKRYQAFLVLLGSKLQSAENGGIRNISDLESPVYANRYSVPTKIGASNVFSNNPFGVEVTTGTHYTLATYMLRQQYDIIGKKDSIVTDSTVIPLFYPRFRAEYTLSYQTYHYRYLDDNPDTTYYIQNLNFIATPDTIKLGDTWHNLSNDFSLYSFPDAKNPQQFVKAGITFQSLHGNYDAGERSLYNISLHGEYRNKTRNKKWDIEALGNFYLSGYNAGDYNAYISLQRQISKNLGFLRAGFENVSRTLSSAWNEESSFGFGVPPGFFKKENVIHLFGSIDQPKLGLRLNADYYLLNNYPYFQNYYEAAQESNPFNILQISADKVIHVSRRWVLRTKLILQQRAGNSPVNIPLFVTHNQFGYEGKLGFKNLVIAFGVELRYYSPYKADGYSPVVGQFFTQTETTIKQKLPDIGAYVNFRIRSFVAYVRTENLNTMQVSKAYGFGFTNNNFVAPDYPSPGLRIRVGIFWSFVN
ncbi:MAG: putative porin [Bacteroidota bacterium]|nr:putative porin [Bacteroidota bacterium]